MGVRRQLHPWTDDDVVQLKQLWTIEGLSGRQIGMRLGRSKSSVIGKAHKLELPRGRSVDEINRDKGRAGEIGAVARRLAMKEKIIPKPAVKPVKPPMIPPKGAPGPSMAVPFIAAKGGQCLYPLWDDSAKIGPVCGLKTGGGPYCEYHQRLCSVPAYVRRP
jgi:GcrA cell cycle regulator